MKIDDSLGTQAVLSELGERIRQVRVASGLKQDEVAKCSGVSRVAVIRLERGEGSTKLATLIPVLRTLRLLHALEAALPSQEYSPLQIADQELRRQRFPTQVRTRKKTGTVTKAWGDGTKIER